MAAAASTAHGRDCALIARLAATLLQDEGVAAEPVAGAAAWRVGPADGAVITHAPRPGQALLPGTFPFHAWVLLPSTGRVFDPTTYQLTLKAQTLDAADGGTTEVLWAPLYLVAKSAEIKTLREVALGAGWAFFYQRVAALEPLLFADPLDPIDIHHARLVMRHPDAEVIGPNHALVRGPR